MVNLDISPAGFQEEWVQRERSSKVSWKSTVEETRGKFKGREKRAKFLEKTVIFVRIGGMMEDLD